jgi:hypothetical protein
MPGPLCPDAGAGDAGHVPPSPCASGVHRGPSAVLALSTARATGPTPCVRAS